MYIIPRLNNTSPVFFLFLIVMLLSKSSSAQTNVEKFGKNRVQYREFNWRYYDTKHFRIYHYDRAGRELARYVAEQVENDINVIENKMGGQFPERFNIILYNSFDEYKQRNIDKDNNSQLRDIPAGTVDVVGDKLVVYFTGRHTDLRRQTRAGMAKVVMERMLFGDNIAEVVKNAILLNLPEWTVNGFIAYVVDGWDDKANSEWKSLVESDPEASFHELSQQNPELAGKAFWKYISDRYGEGTMKELVYTTQLKGNLNQGVKVTLGMKVNEAYDSVMNFYRDVYVRDEALHAQPDTAAALIEIEIPDEETVIKDIKISPRGYDVAYVAWKNGEFDVILQKTQKAQTKASILHGGKIDYNAKPDPNYPLLAWSNGGYKLAIIYKKNNETHLRIYNSLKARIENYIIPDNRFDRLLSMTFMEDDDKMIFSAIKNSQTDLYEFTIRGKRMRNITDDAWDDIQPWYVSGGSRRGILFISNRPEPSTEVPLEVNQMPTGTMNVYFYNTTTKSTTLLKMTDYKSGNVTQPIQYGSEDYAYLYNENGIYNQHIIRLTTTADKRDSANSVAVTDYSRNIISHQYNPISNQVGHVMKVGNKYHVYFKPIIKHDEKLEAKNLNTTLLKQSEQNKKRGAISGSQGTVRQAQDEPMLKRGNAFQSDFDNEGVDSKKQKDEAELVQQERKPAPTFNDENTVSEVDSTYINMRSYQYRLSFKPKDVTLRVDNSMLFTRYQSAGQNGNRFQNPELGGMLTTSIIDLMEDHVFTGGVRIPLNFSGLTYFVRYENYKRRVDWDLMYFRQENKYNTWIQDPETADTLGPGVGKTVTDILQAGAAYPLNKFESIRMQFALRRDAFNYKSQDSVSLAVPQADDRQYWLQSRAEYVFDNTSNPAINIYRGFRYKVFAEYMYKVDGPTSGLYNIGADFRYYKKVYRNITWAFRLNGAHSGGDSKILYFLGGVDNWISPKYADGTSVRVENYGFQAIATNMRGYERNYYNGNSYGVLNTEFRVPLVTSFSNKPIQSAILKNLQMVVFGDLGSAWEGFWPKETNVRNDIVYPDPNKAPGRKIYVNVEDSRSIFGLGYGAGLRTMLFGYFLRGDVAWNVENHRKTPLFHFSIGTDF